MWPMLSPIPPSPTSPHQRPLESAKEIQTEHDQKKFHPQHSDYPPFLIVISHRRPVMERVMETQNMSSRPKIDHKLGQQARTWWRYMRTPTNAWGLRIRYWCDCSTNGALHPARKNRLYRSLRQQYNPSRKPLRRWCIAATRHPTILATLTPERRLGLSKWDSVMPSCWGWQCRLPSEHGRPPGIIPQGSRQHALLGLPGLVQPKSWESKSTVSGELGKNNCLFANPTLWLTVWSSWEIF